jgi:presenilin-like A22 family membrane protease
MSSKAFVQLFALFLITQLLGLAVANVLIKEEVRAVILTDNPEDIENALALFAYILIATAILLILLTFVKVRGITMLFELFALFATATLVFAALVPKVALLFIFTLIALRLLLRRSILIKNIASCVAVAGAGSLIGVSLGVVPTALFLVILSIYDYIAVFKTKHMVKLGEAIARENVAFTFSLPTREKVYQLGTGDLVMPLVFATAVMNKVKLHYSFPYYLVPLALLLFASFLGLACIIAPRKSMRCRRCHCKAYLC